MCTIFLHYTTLLYLTNSNSNATIGHKAYKLSVDIQSNKSSAIQASPDQVGYTELHIHISFITLCISFCGKYFIISFHS